MLIFGDLATRTGMCRGSGLELPSVSSEAMPAGGMGPFLAHFEEYLCDYVADTIDLCDAGERIYAGFESPILRGDFSTNIATLRKLYSLAAMFEVVCWRFAKEWAPGIVVREVQQGTIKSLLGVPRFTPGGKRERIEKEDVWNGAAALGLTCAGFDESDAFGGWLEMVKHYGPAGAWDLWAPQLAAIMPAPSVKAPRARRAASR